jgi:hypothetical protein
MNDSTIVTLRQPDAIDDPLTAVLRSGARRLLAQAIEAEAEAFLADMKSMPLPDGRDRLVRHGHGPERQVQTGIGPVAVQRVRLRDRGAGDTSDRIRFTSATRAPGTKLSWMIRALSSADQRRRRSGPVRTSIRRKPTFASSLTSNIITALSPHASGKPSTVQSTAEEWPLSNAYAAPA